MILVWKLHRFNVGCSSTNTSWWIEDDCCQTSLVSLQYILQNQSMIQRYLNAKSAQINRAEAASTALEVGERAVGGGSTWNCLAAFFVLWGLGNLSAPSQHSLGLAAVCESSPCNNQQQGTERFLQASAQLDQCWTFIRLFWNQCILLQELYIARRMLAQCLPS